MRAFIYDHPASVANRAEGIEFYAFDSVAPKRFDRIHMQRTDPWHRKGISEPLMASQSLLKSLIDIVGNEFANIGAIFRDLFHQSGARIVVPLFRHNQNCLDAGS